MRNSKSSLDYQDLVTKAVAEMLEAGAVSVLPSGVLPKVVSPLGFVAKSSSKKVRLIVNMRYVNEHLAKRVFKFEGLSDLSDMAEKGDFLSLTTLRRGIIMCLFTQIHDGLLDIIGKEFIINIIAFPLVCLQPLGCFPNSSVNF